MIAADSGGKELVFDVQNLEMTYKAGRGRSVKAVKGVSFTLAPGEVAGIVGESGSGKSTVAKALTLLEKPSGGKVLYRGRDVWRFSAAERKDYRRRVQMVFQDATGSLNPRMTVRAMLSEALRHGPSPKRDPAELLDLVGLAHTVLDQYPREMSGGQCQRASFARALAMEPEVLVADEPVSALDVSVQARILNLLRELRSRLNLAVVLIAHDLAVVRNVADTVCVMKEGLFVDKGPAEEVFANPASTYTRNLLDAVPDVERALKNREIVKS